MFNRITIIVVALFSISCTKEILQQKLAVSATPTTGGTVTPPSNSYEKGQSVQILATPSSEYLFKGWNGDLMGTTNPSSIIMDKDKQVIGMFEKRQYPLNLTIEGNGTVKEEVIAVATQSQYPSGTTVRLTALPAEKYEFASWSGDISNTTNPLDIKIDKSISITVKFKIKDTDGDGILDDVDQDNTTRKGVPVDATGRMLNPVYLDGNQVTIKANKWAIVGDKGIIANKEITVIDRDQLDNLIKIGGDYSLICTSKISSLRNIFGQFYKNDINSKYLINFDISSWDISMVTNLEAAFINTTLNSDLSKWDVSNVTNMRLLFAQSNFKQDISNWNVLNVETMEGMFSKCPFNGDLSKWDLKNLKNIALMFSESKFNNQSLNNWVTSNVENMAYAFYQTDFNQDISKWDVSNVIFMQSMFAECSNFNQNLSNWSVSKVSNMESMFFYCNSFNQDISNWDVSKVTNMQNMFNGCHSFNQDLSKWNVNNVSKCLNFKRFTFDWVWTLPKPSFKNCSF